MKYISAPPFRQALERRLPALSHETGRSHVRLRKEVAFDRLLARLVATAPDRWLLKGGLALDYRFGSRARTTRDIDLATAGDEVSATTDLLAAQAVDLGDFFAFAVERTGALDRIRDGAAVRYHVIAELAGRTFDEFVLDVGFDPPVGVELARLRGPDLLAFADLAPVELAALPLEFQIAEKVHAYTRGYGDSAHASTRVKDLVDLALIATEGGPDAALLRAAINRTFARRGSQRVPPTLPGPPPDWRVPYARMARDIGLDPDLEAGHAVAARLLDPILSSEVLSATWDSGDGGWRS
jgi:predicted nucleotidyltransferase component of viral defense system